MESPDTDLLRHYILGALEAAKARKESAGRSEAGRHLALVVTKLEESLLWAKAAEGHLLPT